MKALEFLETLKKLENPVFTVNNLAKIIRKDSRYVRLYIHRMKKNRYLEQIERGKYALKEAHPLGIASNIVFPAYISFLSGIEFFKATTQITKRIYVATLNAKKSLDMEEYEIVFIKLKKERFFGYHKESLNNNSLFIGDFEKIIVDSLYLPEYCPISEIFNALKEKKFNLNKLINYAIKMNSYVLIKRLGFLLEIIGENVYDNIKDKINNTYDLLNPSLSDNHKRNKKWKLIINEVLDYA